MSDQVYTIERLREIIRPVARAYGVNAVWLFGSYARGEANAESDVDLLIDGGRIQTLWQLGGFYEDVKERLDKELDIITTGNSDKRFLETIRNDQVAIYAV